MTDTPAPRISSPEAKVKSLPCQFCGPAAATYVKQNGRFTFQVVCYGGCAGPKASSETEAITAWNACRILSSLAPSSPAGEPEEPLKAALRAYASASKGIRCPICAGTESCDHTVLERLRADASPVPPPLPGEAVAPEISERNEDGRRKGHSKLVYDKARRTIIDEATGQPITSPTPPARALPGITEEMVERAARAVHKAKGDNVPETWSCSLPLARAALEAASISRPAERENVLKLAAWCENERGLLGAVDGYDYRSGEEYGLRRAQLQAEKLARAIPSTDHVGGGE